MADLTLVGKKAEGKIEDWLDKPDEGFCFLRLPDQMTGLYGSKNICDFLLFRSPNFYFLESKATYEDRFDFSMISEYQHDEMLKRYNIDHVTCYVVVLFASYQRAFMLRIEDIKALEDLGVKSVNIKKIDKWTIPYIEIKTVPSRKALLDYDFDFAKEVF